MLVTADDLSAAMRYPLSVIQVLLKAYFGCGIVCGLELEDPAAEKKALETTNGERAAEGDGNFVLTVKKGVALGCDGYPIEICGPLKLDFTPDPCRPEVRPKTMFVAARRVTAPEAAGRPCGCGPTGGEPAQQCTRVRDHALVQAFAEKDLPAALCQVVAPSEEESAAEAVAITVCDCLKQCGECACCGEPWVLLGSVVVGEKCLETIDMSGRRYVKPIACACASAASKGEEKAPARTPGATPAARKPAAG
ncbi:MAG TPA: hypothetical protein VEW25_11000 [Allosphingosinicella sp.]|nr:hypothetical protein [Allosphingosinicella sp.]